MSMANANPLYLDCVHCGLCLPSCPTYRVLGSEMDSPRGRIYLMRAFDEGRADITPSFEQHMFRCLDCRACETACPSGVQFGHMMEEMRAKVVSQRPTSWITRFIMRHVFPYPRRFAAAARAMELYQVSGFQQFLRTSGLLKRLAPEMAATEALMPAVGIESGTTPGATYRADGHRIG